MIGFELRTSSVWSDCSTNWATTIATMDSFSLIEIQTEMVRQQVNHSITPTARSDKYTRLSR